MFRITIFRILATMLLAAALTACGPGEEEPTGEEAVESPPAEEAMPEDERAAEEAEDQAKPAGTGFAVEVIGREYSFEGPDTIPRGWTTFNFRNEGQQHHFLWVYRLPDGKTQEDVMNDLVPIYDRVMEALQEGEMNQEEALEELGESVPSWFFDSEFLGGPGLTAPGAVSRTTVNLDQPGLYIMECYVKGPNGMFHSSMGMQKQFSVGEGASGGSPPEADIEMKLTNDGIQTQGDLTSGMHTVRVEFVDDPPGGFPYDVHLARLEPDTDVEALKQWMNWMNVGGLRAPSPVTFLGGAENMSAGNTAYFTIDLAPGRYAWLSEVGATENMYSEFTVE